MAIGSPARSTPAPDAADASLEVAAGAGRNGAARRARVSAGHLVMVAAGLVGVVLSIAVLRERPSGVRVLVADGEIHAGDALGPDDVRTARLRGPDRLLDALVPSSDVGRVRGRIATASVADGEPLVWSQLRRRAAPGGLRAMSIPIDASRAVGGRIEPGDRVDVVFAGAREASIIVPDARVLAVDQPGRGGIGEVSRPFTITIAVDAEQSQRLAAAIADGELSITRTTGATSSEGTAPLVLDRVAPGGSR